jgi:endonuclease YncB( thermonuclease family)
MAMVPSRLGGVRMHQPSPERAGTLAHSVLIGVMLSGAGAAADGMVAGGAEVIDGDTLTIGVVAIRLEGIDAPELGQRCALPAGGTWGCDEAAADRLVELTTGREVDCEPLERDPYGRIVAKCTAGGVDLSAALAKEGLAWSFTRYSTTYADLEAAAKAQGLGIWQADTQPPWDYRTDRWERAVNASPHGCPIKGNINAEGERIYHTPWSPWYGRTKVNEAAGERWFCDEAEAIVAGWRAARFH